MLERLAWSLLILFILLLGKQLTRIYQQRSIQAAMHSSNNGQASLIVVISARCAICPAQKKIVAQLTELYPAALLRVVTIDAEKQIEQAREYAVMTVPSTILQAADGSITQVNNGYIAYAPLAKQISSLLAQESTSSPPNLSNGARI